MEWDVATFIEALKEAYPLAPGDRHLGHGQRWLKVAYRVQSTVQVHNDDMAALRISLIAEVNNARHTIGAIRTENLQEILGHNRCVLKMVELYPTKTTTALKCFMCPENPWRLSPTNRQFQRDFETLLEKGTAYKHAHR